MEHAGKGKDSLQPRSYTGQESPFCLSCLRWLTGAKVTYFGLRLRRHLPGIISNQRSVQDCWGALAASALSGHSRMSQGLFSQATPSHTLPSKAQGEEETGNYSIRQSGSRFFGPNIKAYRDKNWNVLRGNKCCEVPPALGILLELFLSMWFSKSFPTVQGSCLLLLEHSRGAGGKQQLFH